MTPLVVDIYHGNIVNSFAQVKAAGIQAIIHKASQGTGIVDGEYAARRPAALAAGLLWGAYHFFDHSDPVQQARHFLSVASPTANTLVALDWEDIGSSPPGAAAARAFLEEILNQLNRPAVLYSGNVAKEEIIGKDSFFGMHRLWLAQYANDWKVQESWTAPWLWQYSESGAIRGLKSPTDLNTTVDPNVDLASTWASEGPMS